MKRVVFYCILSLLLFSRAAFAQNVVFSAQASARTVGMEDRVQVTFSIQNVEGLRGITEPSFKDFQVVGGPYQSRSTNIVFDGNSQRQTSTISFTYVLQPTHTGTFTIPPVTAKDGADHTYQSNALQIQVVAGSTAPKQQIRQQSDPFGDDPFGDGDPFEAMRQQQARMMQMLQQMQQQAGGGMQQAQSLPEISESELNKNIFIKVTVDKTKVRVGEQITATYKLYARIPMQVVLSKLPLLTGFWTQDFELPKDQNQKPVAETINGVQYQSFVLKKSALFPQQTGTLQLDPAEGKGVAKIPQRTNNPFNPYAYRDVQVTLKSDPVAITVTALPEKDKPASFSGAVGNFSVTSSIDKTSLSTDETANLTLNIAGSGNLKLIEAPKLQLPNGLDVYDPVITDTITGRSTTISGNKIISYAIAPRLAGDYEIPAIAFSYFNSRTNTYETLHTQPVKLHVTEGKNYKKEAQQAARTLTDIRAIDTKPVKLQQFSTPLFFKGIYWLIYILAAVAFAVFVILQKRNASLAGNVTLLKNKRANKVALKRLKTAKQLLADNKAAAFYEEISKAIWLYLSDKLAIPLSQLSKESAAQALTVRNVPAALQEKVNRIIDDCEWALYAPGGGQQKMNQTYTDAVTTIGELEDIFKS